MNSIVEGMGSTLRHTAYITVAGLCVITGDHSSLESPFCTISKQKCQV